MFQKLIYLNKLNTSCYKYKNSIELPLILNGQKEINIYVCFYYIKVYNINDISHNIHVKNKYIIFNKNNKSFSLINTYFPYLQLQDIFNHKNVYIKYNYTLTNYIFSKNIICSSKVCSQITHRHYINKSNIFFFNYLSRFHYNLKIQNLKERYDLITNKYYLWNNISLNIYKFNFYKGIYFVNNTTSFKSTKINDITSGLLSIETIFEARSLLNSHLIPTKCSILEKLFIHYEDIILNYIWTYSLFDFKNNNLLYYTELNNNIVYPYENSTSIILPQNIITCGNYSINILLLRLFSHNLEYYNQDQAIKISHLFAFNLIVESLLKQYLKNGVIIPSIQFELLVKKMTSFVRINHIGSSSLIENDIFDFSILESLNYSFYTFGYTQLLYTPIVLGISKSILCSSGFLASISFQDIIKNLMSLTVENSVDWLTDLKSKIITTDLIKTGSGWYRHFIKI